MRSAKFDWFSLDRNSLFDLMHYLETKLVGQKMSIPQFHNKVVNHIKKYLPIKFRRVQDPLVDLGHVWVGGCYYSDYDQHKQKCIEIVMAYNRDQKQITITKRRFTRMCLGFADTLLHEIIHMRQYRRRNFKVIPDYPSTANRQKIREEQSYLGCRDEIDAYAFNIACELMDKFNFKEREVITYINENQKGLRRAHNSYRMYLKAFGHDHSHPIIKKLKKRVVGYLPRAAVGKPYKNSEWIRN